MSSNTAHEPEDLSLDSTYFVAFEMAHGALKAGLARASKLSITQYRLLTKVVSGSEAGALSQSDVRRMLGLAANVVTQAVDVLEDAGFAKRLPGDDARTRYLTSTSAGAEHVARVNASLVDALYELFPTQNPTYRTILEAAINAAALIDPPLSEEAAKRYSASRALVSVELIRQETERTLRAACGASFNECRVVQRLGEAGSPLRVRALAEQLDLSAVNVARASERLASRGWARKLASPVDRKAVYVALTDEGAFQAEVIGATVNELGRERLWGHLEPKQRAAISKVGHVVVADLRAKKEREERHALTELREI